MEFMGPREEPDLSYFEGGRISAEAVEAMFSAARIFYELAPWKMVQDTQVLRVDIPSLDVVGACVSIIGAQGQSLGMIIFPSLAAFDRFLEAAESFEAVDSTIDLGTRTLSLNYERGADLPRTMRREIAAHKWPVANGDAYPWVQHRDRDGIMILLTEREVRIVTACAASLSAFFAKHSDNFLKVIGKLLNFTRGISDECKEVIEKVGKCPDWEEEEKALSFLGEDWVGEEGVALALYCFLRYPDSYEKCLLRAANTNGDSDSIAYIAGAISGAYLGVKAIPRGWVERIENKDYLIDLGIRLAGARRRL